MKRILFFTISVFVLFSCGNKALTELKSPDGQVSVSFKITDGGQPTYAVYFKGEEVIKPSLMGFDFTDNTSFDKGINIENSSKSSFSETWEMPWGEKRFVDNNYNELKITKTSNKWNIG